MGLIVLALAVPAGGVGGLIGCQKNEGAAVMVAIDAGPGAGGFASGGSSDTGGATGAGGSEMGDVAIGVGGPGNNSDAQPAETQPEMPEMPAVVEPPVDAGVDASIIPPTPTSYQGRPGMTSRRSFQG